MHVLPKTCNLWFLFTALLIPLAFVAFFLAPHERGRITEAAYAQIKQGMPRTEVEARLGGPPGNYAASGRQEQIERFTMAWGSGISFLGTSTYLSMIPTNLCGFGAPSIRRPPYLCWWGDEASIGVCFDGDGNVLSAYLQSKVGVTFWQRLWRRLFP